MKSLAPCIFTIFIFLIGCSELSENSVSQLKSDSSTSNFSEYEHKKENTSVKAACSTESEDNAYSAMSSQERNAEIVKIKSFIDLLEAKIDIFSDDDSRWDILDQCMDKILKLRKAETVAAKQAADEAKQAADEAKQAADAGQKALNAISGTQN